LYTRPVTPRVAAKTLAFTASDTKVKSRVSSPSPKTAIGSPRMVARRDRSDTVGTPTFTK